VVLYGLGLALEETLHYLGTGRPTYDEFERWILERNGGSVDAARLDRIDAATRGRPYGERVAEELRRIEDSAPVLTREDLAFWNENGYVVLHEAVSAENCRASARAVWEFLDMNPEAPDTWYKKRGQHGIMVQFFHHPALAANRGSRRLHKAFAQIWNTADLWVTVDRVSFNPPERPEWKFPGPRLHWDTTLTLPIAFNVSGVLYLTDTSAEQGAFTCVPGFHRRLAAWLAQLPPGADPRAQDLEVLGGTPVPGKAGDLIIWHNALPHGSRPNHATRPRIVQYISMFSADVSRRSRMGIQAAESYAPPRLTRAPRTL
jgi:hypothetical protein